MSFKKGQEKAIKYLNKRCAILDIPVMNTPLHWYYFQFMFDAPNSVSGVMSFGWTGRFEIEAETYQKALEQAESEIKRKYPNAQNVRNIKQRG